MDKSRLLDKVGAIGDDRLLLAKVLDRAEQAQSRNIPAATDLSLIHISEPTRPY